MDGYIRIILIILGVIFFIYRRVNAARRQQQNTNVPSQGNPKPSSTSAGSGRTNPSSSIFDELIESVLEEQERKKTSAHTQTATLEDSSRERLQQFDVDESARGKRDYYDYDYEKKSAKRAIKSDIEEDDEFVRSDAYKLQQSDNYTLKNIKSRLSTPEGARDAFIMSEIFNKKF